MTVTQEFINVLMERYQRLGAELISQLMMAETRAQLAERDLTQARARIAALEAERSDPSPTQDTHG